MILVRGEIGKNNLYQNKSDKDEYPIQILYFIEMYLSNILDNCLVFASICTKQRFLVSKFRHL